MSYDDPSDMFEHDDQGWGWGDEVVLPRTELRGALMKSTAEKSNQKPLEKFMGETSDNMSKRPRARKKKKLKKSRFKEGGLANFLKGFYTTGKGRK